MKPFDRLTEIAAALPLENIDTDKILPSRFMKTTSRGGLGRALFAALREDPNFVLNRSPWDKAGILIALDNFGCGSSREHAPWALLDFGIRCIIAPSFADIFYNNCFKNSILPILLPMPEVRRLIAVAAGADTAEMTVDLAVQKITIHSGGQIAFPIDDRRKQNMLNGIDEIARTMDFDAAITGFEQRRASEAPWQRYISHIAF